MRPGAQCWHLNLAVARIALETLRPGHEGLLLGQDTCVSGAEAAVLGAAVGAVATVGVAVVQAVFHQRAEAGRRQEAREATVRHERTTLVRKYLFQLQDAVESFDVRLANWADFGGEEHSERVDPGYWRISTLYVVARALAAERILVLEGVYPQLENASPGLGEFLKRSSVDHAIRNALGGSLFQYHRMALADLAVDREADGFRVVTYTEFRRRCEDVGWGADQLLETTYAALAPLRDDKQRLATLRKSLNRILLRLNEDAGVGRSA